ncbi:uncharacterized protein C9orf43 homolog [Tupaia chinensis]|nr:uncharacterized protein C9orf43 homolog [Tupaia chinensis]
MDLPDESQWDETTCDMAVCQHPQCWATVRRIETGHPRILNPVSKTPVEAEDKLPALTIIDISDSCLQAKGLAGHLLSEFTFTKAHSLLCRYSKFGSRFQGRPQKSLPNRSSIKHTNSPPKLSVLDLNETQLPSSNDVRDTIVLWIPEETEKHVRPAEKKPIFSSPHRRRLALNKFPLDPSGKQETEALLRTPGVMVPPPSPVLLFEQSGSQSTPLYAQLDMLPDDLLQDLLAGGGKMLPWPEMKIQLAMMKKSLPLAKTRPESALSSKMFLSVRRLTLQTPALRYPGRLRKAQYKPKAEATCADTAISPGHRKQQQPQQQKKARRPTKKQEAKKKAKSDPGSQNPSRTRSVPDTCDPVCEASVNTVGMAQEGEPHSGHGTSPGQESDMKQQHVWIEEAGLEKDSTETLDMDYSEDFLDFFSSMESIELLQTESADEDISALVKTVLEDQDVCLEENLLENMAGTSWNPELKLLRILQDTDDKEEENQPPGDESLEA